MSSKTDDKAEVEPTHDDPEDSTPDVLRSWGLSGQPVSWAPESYQPAIATIRSCNRGVLNVAAVQAVLDASFPGAEYHADEIALAHPPDGEFTATVTDMSVRVDLAADADLVLPDEHVEWSFGDGTTVWDAGGWDHEYGAEGEYEVRVTEHVAGAAYTTTQAVTVPAEEAPPEGRKRKAKN